MGWVGWVNAARNGTHGCNRHATAGMARKLQPATFHEEVRTMRVLALALLLWFSCTGMHSADADTAQLYHNYCSVCHGDKGDGRSRAAGSLSTMPRDFTSADSKRELSRERIVAAITHGRPGTAMVAWKSQLSEADIARLADYVYGRFVQGGAASTPGRVDMTAGLPNGLKGDPKRGGVFYNANCATCHGLRGDGAGPRAYFINPKPRNLASEDTRSRFNRVALFAAISEGKLGTEMPAWRQVATTQQLADVAEYVFRSFVQPPAATAAR